MIDGLDKLAEIEVLREAAQRPPAEVQRMQPPSPQAGLQSLGQQEVDMGTGMPVGFSPADAVGQVTNIAGQYAMANPQKTGPFAAALAAFGAGSEAANMIDKRVEAESQKENLDDVKSMAGSLPDRTRTVMPAMPMPVQAQEEIQVSEVAPSIMTMSNGGKIPSSKTIRKISKDISQKELYERLIAREAIGEGKLGMALVARSIDNRYDLISDDLVRPGEFNSRGKSLKDIMLGSGQYEPVGTGKVLNPLTKAEKEKVREAISLAKNTEKLTEELRKQNKSEKEISNFLNSTGFRTLTAKDDPSQNVNRTQFKKHIFNTAGNVTFNNIPILNKEDKTDSYNKTKDDLEKLALLKQTTIETPTKEESKDTGFMESAREAGRGLLNLLGRDYTVKRGDTLSSIAEQSRVSVEDLLESNPNIVDRDKIYAGQEVDIPNFKSFAGQFKNALGLQEGGDVGEYFEGQVEGKGDGMSDEIPFRVEGGNPDFALLSKDEYVIPADVVSMLGNGSSDAGADELDDFLKDVRKEAFGREEQQKEINADKGLSSIA